MKRVLETFRPSDIPVVWFYGSSWQNIFNDMPGVEFIKGFTSLREGAINVVDDLMEEMKDNKELSEAFTKGVF